VATTTQDRHVLPLMRKTVPVCVPVGTLIFLFTFNPLLRRRPREACSTCDIVEIAALAVRSAILCYAQRLA